MVGCWDFALSSVGVRGVPVVVRAARAVDTVTQPDAQRRVIFSLLTRTAIEALRKDGVALVFNLTPAEPPRAT